MRPFNAALVLAALVLAGCANPPPPAATLDSGVTSSNGGGQRALGDLPNVSVSNGKADVTRMPRDPRVPTY